MPAFEYEVWILMLAFPMDYMTEHYVHKAVSRFGKLLAWPRPDENKARVLFKCHIKDVAEVPHSLLVTKVGLLPGLGRSWSVLIYVLNGRNTVPGLQGNEDTPPLLNASPHPYALPYYTIMQQARIEEMEAQQAANEAMWNGNEQVQEQVQDNGWRAWPVIPPPYTGFSFRTYFEYDGPSLMDGVSQEHNLVNNLSDAWSEYSHVEEIADNFINGAPSAVHAFVRAGGSVAAMFIATDSDLLSWMGGMLKRIYTRTILPVESPSTTCFPLNPFAAIKFHLDSMCLALLACVRPEADVFGRIFSSAFSVGLVFVMSASLDDSNLELPALDVPLSDDIVSLDVPACVDNYVGLIRRMMLKEPAHVDTVLLRHSARSNKYDGFRVPPLTDKRTTTSKVKPRKDPSLPGPSTTGAPNTRRHDKVSDTVPPRTSIHAIQSIGTNMCGVHPSQLSEDKLLATQEMHKSNTGGLDAA